MIKVCFRLVRVRQRNEYGNKGVSAVHSTSKETGESVCLFEEYAVINRRQKTFWIGQVIRMIHNGKDYRRPVPFNDPHASDIVVHIVKFQSQASSETTLNKTCVIEKAQVSDILSHVEISFESPGVFTVEQNDIDHIKETIKEMFPAQQKTRKQSHQVQQSPQASEHSKK